MISDSDIQDEDHTSSLHSAKSKDHNQNESKGLSSLPTTLLESHQIQCITALNISDVKLRKRSEETLYNGKPPIPESFSQHFNPSQNTSEDAQLIKSEATKFKRVNIKDLKLREENIIHDEKENLEKEVYIDEKGRRCIEGKPRSSDFFSIDFESPTNNKKNSKISFKGITKGLKELLPSKNSANVVEVNQEEHVIVGLWNSKKREVKEWKDFDPNSVPEENLCLLDQLVLKDGFHFECGEKEMSENNLAKYIDHSNDYAFDHSDEYVPYYSTYLYPVEHNNYIGYDEESDTYWIISIESKPFSRSVDQVRALVRSSKSVHRCCIEYVQTCTLAEKAKGVNPKISPLFKIYPALEKVKLSKVKIQDICEELHSMEMKEVILGRRYKFGVLYVKPNQTEDEIFANDNMSPDFEEFLEFLGSKIELKGWKRYNGGLDCKNDTTGTHSVYNELNGVEIMFHVGSMLPSNEKDQQRVEKKRHIGNDVVVFIFLEEGCEPHNAKKFTSQFIHVQFVIQKIPNQEETSYRVSVVTKSGVEPHNPVLPSIIKKTTENSKLILTKAINAERTVMLSPEFRSKMNRTRKDFLKHLYETYKKKK